MMRNAALEGKLVEQIRYSISNELVSSDIVGDSCASIFDSPATQFLPMVNQSYYTYGTITNTDTLPSNAISEACI